MAITQLGNGRWRVQIRRKELKLDRVFDTKKEAIQAEALALGKVKPKETVKTLADVWEKYQESLEFNSKKLSTQKTEHVRRLCCTNRAGRTTPIPRRTYPMRTVCGVPSAVKRFKIAAQI